MAPALVKLQAHLGKGNRLRYLCQAETRMGLQTETGTVTTAFGVKPVVPVQWQRANFWLSGVVEPLSGWHFTQEYAHLDTAHFQQFIQVLAEQLGDDTAVLQLDQAGAHMTAALHWPETLIPIAQPPHSPELNPIERVWQCIKAKLKGECFATLEP